MNKRAVAATWLGRTGLAKVKARRLKSSNRDVLRILAYHRILDAGNGYALDPGVVSATPETFWRQMEFVRDNFTAISFGDLAQIVEGHKPVPLNPIIISFDDGYRDNYTTAFPILRKLSLPATIFLVTGHIGTGRMFWWDRIVYSIHRAQAVSCRFDLGNGQRDWPLSTPTERAFFSNAVLLAVKLISEDEKNQLIVRLEELLDVGEDFPGYEQQLLTWEQVREMAQGGLEFGSHTRTHPVLANVTARQLHEELEQSKQDIESEVGTSPVAVAYPAGKASRYNAAVLEAVEQAGYQFGVTYDNGLNEFAHLCRWELRRMAVEADDTIEKFMGRVTFARLQ